MIKKIIIYASISLLGMSCNMKSKSDPNRIVGLEAAMDISKASPISAKQAALIMEKYITDNPNAPFKLFLPPRICYVTKGGNYFFPKYIYFKRECMLVGYYVSGQTGEITVIKEPQKRFVPDYTREGSKQLLSLE